MDDSYEGLRPLMFSIAYRMVGSVSEAEDIVQEAYLKVLSVGGASAPIDSPKAYFSTVTTRLSIDYLRSARQRRETYVGPWLPEPLLVDPAPDAAQHAEIADSLSLAFLVLLESLSPVERAVFILRDVFGYGYDEIAAVVGKSAENCRQLVTRARHRVEERKPRFEASRERRRALAAQFFAAAVQGDSQGLLALLSADVVAYTDGGGKTEASPVPVVGRDNVLALLGVLAGGARRMGASGRLADVNGQPGVVFTDPQGRLLFVTSLDIADGLVQAIRSVSNPDKLRHLGPVADPHARLQPPVAPPGG